MTVGARARGTRGLDEATPHARHMSGRMPIHNMVLDCVMTVAAAVQPAAACTDKLAGGLVVSAAKLAGWMVVDRNRADGLGLNVGAFILACSFTG